MNGSRSLSLHESALSPHEYTTYTELFNELVEPPDTVLGVREARGYLKGRYSGLETGTVDKVFTSQIAFRDLDIGHTTPYVRVSVLKCPFQLL